jgi:hypothetical protein
VRELRVVAVGGAVAILAAAWIGRPPGSFALEPSVVGIAYLSFVAAVALLFGAVPFHLWVARLPDAAPPLALPALLVWTPAAFAVVALAWVDQSVLSLLVPLDLERTIIVGVAITTIALGAVAAWLADDIAHVVGYTIVADCGFILLALAATDGSAMSGAREWILVIVAVKAALSGVAVVLRLAFGTRRIEELAGWGRRLPALLAALVVAVIATVGVPGIVRSWATRAALVDGSIGGPLAPVVVACGLLSLLAYGRLMAVGLRLPAAPVLGGRSERLRVPPPIVSTRRLPGGPPRDTVERAGLLLEWARAEAQRGLRLLAASTRLNRVPIASGLVLLLAVGSLALAMGGLGSHAAAAEAVPVTRPTASTGPSNEPSPAASAGSSLEPTPEPTTRGSPAASPGPTGTPDASAGQSAAPTFSLQPLPSPSGPS